MLIYYFLMSNLPIFLAKILTIYTTKFVPQSISLNLDFSLATWSMTALSTGTNDIVAQIGVTIAAPESSFIPAAGTYANQTVTYSMLQLQVEHTKK